MSAIPNHVMQGAILPIHLCEKLDKINRDFLGGSTNEKRRMHLVGWEKVIRPKEEGGLGIQSARAKNLALLAKLNWHMYHEKEALWARMLLTKYCSNAKNRSNNPDSLPSSPNWNAIKVGFPYFSKGIWWRVGNNSKKSVWMDNWICGQPLRELIEGPLTKEDLHLIIVDFRTNNDWRWESLSFALLPCIKEIIRAIPVQEFGIGEDVLMWKFTKDGDFSTSSAYLSIKTEMGMGNSFKGARIWKFDTIPRIMSYLWLCMDNSVPVREVLAGRGINCNPLCPICR